MIHIVWEFRIKLNKRRQFENYYSGNGKWAVLFRRSSGFRNTLLVQDTTTAERYFVLDTWNDIDSFQQFKKRFAKEYDVLDKKCEAFTEEERCLGFFQDVVG